MENVSDEKNVQTLPSFTEFGAGMSYQLGRIRFAVDGTNIFNTIGITEGDPRAGSPNGDGIIMARPIMGAAARASITLVSRLYFLIKQNRQNF